VFEIGRTTNLVDRYAGSSGWKTRPRLPPRRIYRAALARGFSEAEVAEQLAGIRTALENQVAAADTRSHSALVGGSRSRCCAMTSVPTTPASALERFNRFAACHHARRRARRAASRSASRSKAAAATLSGPRCAEGRCAGPARQRGKLRYGLPMHRPRASQTIGPFAYTDFGPAGTPLSAIAARRLRLACAWCGFANGVRLNLKRTDLEKDRVLVRLARRWRRNAWKRGSNPLATEMAAMLPAGGLGKHSQDDLQTLLAGRSVCSSIGASGDVFSATALTTRRDLELQLQLLTATITDPGYRPEVDLLYRQSDDEPVRAAERHPGLGAGRLRCRASITGGDPRFTLQPPDAYQRLTLGTAQGRISQTGWRGARSSWHLSAISIPMPPLC